MFNTDIYVNLGNKVSVFLGIRKINVVKSIFLGILFSPPFLIPNIKNGIIYNYESKIWGIVMKTNKLLSAIKKAPFPTIMAIISFILFLVAYSFVTVKAIKPYYLMGLIFIIPFVSFGIIAYFTARAEIVPVISYIITILLIVVSVLIMFVTFTFISIDAATTETTDIEMYERVLKLKDYPENTLINYFPEKKFLIMQKILHLGIILLLCRVVRISN